ncbi:MAG: hypothetical protein ACO2O6_10545 [Candidatus Hydrothermia bacterium]|jgi:uncharacterized protein (DUF1499 family)
MNVRIRYVGTKDKNVALEEVVKMLINIWKTEGYENAVKWIIRKHSKFKFINDIYIDTDNKSIEIRAGKSLYRIEEQKLSHK